MSCLNYDNQVIWLCYHQSKYNLLYFKLINKKWTVIKSEILDISNYSYLPCICYYNINYQCLTYFIDKSEILINNNNTPYILTDISNYPKNQFPSIFDNLEINGIIQLDNINYYFTTNITYIIPKPLQIIGVFTSCSMML